MTTSVLLSQVALLRLSTMDLIVSIVPFLRATFS